MTVKQTSCIYGEEFGASGRSETDPHTYFFDSSSSASAKTSSKSNPSPADISFSPSASSLSISRSCSPFLYASKLSNTATALPPRVTTAGPLDFCTRFSAADASCCSLLNGIVLRALAIFLPPTPFYHGFSDDDHFHSSAVGIGCPADGLRLYLEEWYCSLRGAS